MSDRLFLWFRVAAVTIFLVVAGYTFAEWWYWHKSGLGEVRPSVSVSMPKLGETISGVRDPEVAAPAPEPVRVVDVVAAQQAVLAKVAAHEEKAGRLVLEIDRLQRQVRVLRGQLDARDQQIVTLQHEMAALKGLAVPVVHDGQLFSLAKEFGFTKVQVRP